MGVCLDQVVDLLDHVAFQASDDVAFGLALGPLGLSALTEGGFAGLLPRDPTQALGSHQRLDGARATVTLSRLSSAWILRAP